MATFKILSRKANVGKWTAVSSSVSGEASFTGHYLMQTEWRFTIAIAKGVSVYQLNLANLLPNGVVAAAAHPPSPSTYIPLEGCGMLMSPSSGIYTYHVVVNASKVEPGETPLASLMSYLFFGNQVSPWQGTSPFLYGPEGSSLYLQMDFSGSNTDEQNINLVAGVGEVNTKVDTDVQNTIVWNGIEIGLGGGGGECTTANICLSLQPS